MTTTDDLDAERVELALDARYALDRGKVYVTGSQALARLPVEQLRADRRAGARTSAFVSGYQGSPLAGFDRDVRAAASAASDVDVVFRAGLNEELAATAVMGSQLAPLRPGARYDGVVGVWFGKSPGLDRASDAIRHAVFAGTHRLGGVVALVGDDPSCKSSTLPSSSDAALAELLVPFVVPGSLQDAVDLGRHAIAQSRASGLWSGVKVATALADAAGTITLDPDRVSIDMPTFDIDGVPYVPAPTGRVAPPWSNALEVEVRTTRLAVATMYGTLNRLNRITHDAPSAWIGLVASGITYRETLEALRALGLESRDDIAAAGIRLVELRQPWPLDPVVIRSLCSGLSEVVVIEEKHRLVELAIRDALYGSTGAPVVVGHIDDRGLPLVPVVGMLDADALREPLRRRLEQRLGNERLAPPPVTRERISIPLTVSRTPYFCSGCPHNQSTRVPSGSLVGAGIGCHGMVTLMEPERVGELAGITCMGNEGAQWIGMAPFVSDQHLFQNLGDGTYAHSGHLAIRAAVAAGVSMTYKLLFNDAVAMTGGQDAAGARSVPDVAHILMREGVRRIIITTDEPGRHKRSELPPGVEVWDRGRIIEAQELLRSVDGVTALIHDQQCAAEKRRDRKRGIAPRPRERVVINERICEGCGDCGEKSNCLSVQPVLTPFGRKTVIDQSSCNLDLTCIDGDCPSFATVTVDDEPATGPSPAPAPPPTPEPLGVVPADDLTIRIPGIGGTGVVTLSQVIGTAALADGFRVFGLDQTGLAQKAGPVVSDLRIARADVQASNKATSASVDLYLVCDAVVASTPANLASLSPDASVVIGTTAQVPTGSMIAHPERGFPDTRQLCAQIDASSRQELNRWVDAAACTAALFGETSTANVFLLGVAYQAGALPVSAANIEQALEINGVSVDRNVAAFRWGRAWYHDPDSLATVTGADPDTTIASLPTRLARRIDALDLDDTTGDLVRMLTADLVGYQSAKYAARYLDAIIPIADVDSRLGIGDHRLTEAASRNLHKLMAYKDEYEVARLLLAPEADRAARTVGGRRTKVTWHLHPPALKSIGLNRKIRLGPSARPIMKFLASAKRLRGTSVDPFGHAHVRRLERELREEFIATLAELAERVDATNYDLAVRIAELPDGVRGYEDLKVRRAAEYRAALAASMLKLRSAGPGLAGRQELSHQPDH